MIQLGPVERAKRLLEEESINIPSYLARLYGQYFLFNAKEEDRIERDMAKYNLFMKSKKEMMSAKQSFQDTLERHALDPNDNRYASEESLKAAADRLLVKQDEYGAVRLRLGFTYSSWHDYYQQHLLNENKDNVHTPNSVGTGSTLSF